jgi:hypothetical protein
VPTRLAVVGAPTGGVPAQGRTWGIDHRTGELPAGLAADVRAWLLLLDGDAPQPAPVKLQPLHLLRDRQTAAGKLGNDPAHLREITTADVTTVLQPLRGWQRRNAIAALRSLFRFARKRGLVFTNPAARLKAENLERALLPMTHAEIRAIEHIAVSPPQRLVIALAAVHAARPAAVRPLSTTSTCPIGASLSRHTPRLGELTHQALRVWLDQRRASWAHTPNRHVLISPRTAMGTGPVSRAFLHGTCCLAASSSTGSAVTECNTKL